MLLDKSKIIILLLLGSIIVFGFLSGCALNRKNTDHGTKVQDVETTEAFDHNKPIDISMFLPSRLADALYSSETLTFKKLAKETNTKLSIHTVVSSEAKDKFDVIVTSGEMPDIMAGTLSDMNSFGISGAFIPLNDLIEEYAPNLKHYLIDNKEVLSQTVASDGNIYGVPMLTAIHTAMGYCIRKDWLDKLSLDIPVTVDDWYNVLTAFKNHDLNGNGIGAVTPLILDRTWENYYMNFADAWGIELNGNGDYWMIKDDQVVFAPILSETKEFLKTMAKWYQEGLIDSEFITRENTVNYHILNNKAGAACYWVGYVASQNKNVEVLKNEPDTNWQVVQPPVLVEGQEPKTFSQQSAVGGYAWGISSTTSTEEIMAILKIFDYVYSDEGSMLFNFGVEGDSYKVVEGIPTYTEKVVNSEEGIINWIRSNGMQPLIGMRQLPEYEAASCLNDDVRKQLFYYVNNNYFYPYNPSLVLKEEEKDLYDLKMSPILTYVNEEILKFLVGVKPIDQFDNFVARIQEMGIEDMLLLKNQAYDRYKILTR